MTPTNILKDYISRLANKNRLVCLDGAKRN